MKRRVFSALLALVMALGLAGPAGLAIPAQAATSTSDARAYLDILNRTNPTDSYLIDFDGDGRDELLTVTTINVEWNRVYSVYQGNTALATDVHMGVAVSPRCDVWVKDGKTYITDGNSNEFGDFDDYYTVHNGQWVKEIGLEHGSTDDEWSSGVTHYRIDDREVSEAEYNRVATFEYQFSLLTNQQSNSVYSRLEAIVEAARAEMGPTEILAEIPYTGDRSQCRLTAEQAEAFAAIIEDQIAKGKANVGKTYDDGGVIMYHIPDFVMAALFDAGDGIPALWVCRGWYDNCWHSDWGTDLPIEAWEVNTIWEWDGTKAVVSSWDHYGWSMNLTNSGMLFRNYQTAAYLPMSNGRIAAKPTEYYVDLGFSEYDFMQAISGCNTYEDAYNYTQLPASYVEKKVQEKDQNNQGDIAGDLWWIPGLRYDYTNMVWDGHWSNGDYEEMYTKVRLSCPGGYDKNRLAAPTILETYGTYEAGNSKYGNWQTGEKTAASLRAYATALKLQNATPDEILAEIPYYGDRSQCRLTSEQAMEMARTLENWTGVTEWAGTGRYVCAYLVDGDGSGIPVLVVVSEVYEGSAHAMDWLDIYNWESGGLKKDSLSTSYIGFYGHDHCSFGKYANGQYGWNSQYGHMGYAYFIPYRLQNGLLVMGKSYNVDENNNDNAEEDWARYRELTAPHRLAEMIDYKTGSGRSEMISLLRAYADAKKYPIYSYAQAETGDSHYADVTAAVAGRGTIQTVYKLLEDMYYVLLENGGAYTGAVVRGVRENGRPIWKVTRTDEEPVEEDALTQLVNQLASAANLNLDYSRLQGSPTLDSLTAYLRQLLGNIDGLAPNDPAKSNLAAFLDGAVSSLASGTVSGKDNRLNITSETVSPLAAGAREASSALNAVLRDNGVELNKILDPVVRVLWSGVDDSAACQITLDSSAAQALGGYALQVLLGDGRTYVRVPADDLSALTRSLGSLSVQLFEEEPGVYAVSFLNGNGEVVDQLSRPVTISLPASGALSTVMASYAGGSSNWGGQYDAAAGTLSFETSFSGKYEVLENNVDIDDIGGLSEESRAAISFMVSKGYLRVEDGMFRPADPLTRYEFTEALVSMFFALDPSLTATFPDVPADSPYYAYVASAQTRDIVRGLDDGTFAGESNITREQVFALAARTLIDQKGYAQPANLDSYLGGFSDRADISAWAEAQVALAVREGIAARGSALWPQANINREQAAVVLYRLFQRLYEVSPVALDVPGAEPEAGSAGFPVLAVVIPAVGVAAAAAAAAVLVKKKSAAESVLAAAPAAPAAPAPTPAAQAPAAQPEAAPDAPSAGPNFCPECGTPLEPGANFCPECGKPIKE